jgi:hypothetical protein
MSEDPYYKLSRQGLVIIRTQDEIVQRLNEIDLALAALADALDEIQLKLGLKRAS